MNRTIAYIVVPVGLFFAYVAVRAPALAWWRGLTKGDEPIVRKTRPRLNVMKRTLGAMIPLETADKTWFVKLTGTEKELAVLEQPLLQFIKSMRFDNPDAPTWTLPAGWSEEEPTEKLRYKTILTGPKDESLEILISFLPGKQELDGNINRWRGQLGLAELGRMDLEGFYRKEAIAGREVIVVDLIGPGARGRAAPMMAQRDPLETPRDPQAASFKYKAPGDWKPMAAGQFSELAFEVGDGKNRAVVTVSRLGGEGGGLLANVNRWRDQVGLKPIDEAQFARDSRAIVVDGSQGKLVDLDGGAASGKRILGVIVPRAAETYFFKLTGPSEAAGKQKDAFEAFVKSVTFAK